jgi:hypothetical protein
MRPSALALLCALPLFLAPLQSHAADLQFGGKGRSLCEAKGDADTRVSHGTPLVVEAGAPLQNVVAIESDVVVRAGATVRTAVAVRGRVILEAGARVTESIVVLDGEAQVDPAARVDGTARVLLGKELLIIDEDGTRAEVPAFLSWFVERQLRQGITEALAECKARPRAQAQQASHRQ